MNPNYIKRNGLFNYYITKIEVVNTKLLGYVSVTVQLENPETGLLCDGSGWTYEQSFLVKKFGDKEKALKEAEFYAVKDMMSDLAVTKRDITNYLPKWSY